MTIINYDCKTFIVQVKCGCMGPRYVLKLLFSESHKIEYYLEMIEGKVKISVDFESLEFWKFFEICLTIFWKLSNFTL